MPMDELEALMKKVVPMAEKFLEEHGTFPPYAGAMTKDGEVHLVGVKTDEKYESADALIESLLENLQRGAKGGTFKATALVLDVEVPRPGETTNTDAIRTLLEHEDGTTAEAYIPYKKTGAGGVEYGEMFAAKGPRRIWK